MNFMKHFFAITLMLLFTGVIFVPNANAQSTFNRKTHVTFSGSVEIPGRVLPAGTYTFQLNVLPGNQTSIVQILNEDGTRTIANLLTITDYRLTPTDKTVMTFSERAGDRPNALRAWFYPGENFGHEFAYPRKRAQQLAAANHENVPAIPDQTADNDLNSAQVTEATPDGTQTEVAQATSASPDNSVPVNDNAAPNNSNSNNLVASNQPLPKTASPVSSIALLGVFFLAIGAALGFIRRFSLTGNHQHRS
jgi:hypothetical protein